MSTDRSVTRAAIAAYINRFRNSPPKPPAERKAESTTLPDLWWQTDACEPGSHPSSTRASPIDIDDGQQSVLSSAASLRNSVLMPAANGTVSDESTANVLARAMAVINASRKMFEEGILSLPAGTETFPSGLARSGSVPQASVNSTSGVQHASVPAISTENPKFAPAIRSPPKVIRDEEHAARVVNTSLIQTATAPQDSTSSVVTNVIQVPNVIEQVQTDLQQLYVDPSIMEIEDPSVTIARLRRRLAILDQEVAPKLAPYSQTYAALTQTPQQAELMQPQPAQEAQVFAPTHALPPLFPHPQQLSTTSLPGVTMEQQVTVPSERPVDTRETKELSSKPDAQLPHLYEVPSPERHHWRLQLKDVNRRSMDTSASFLWDLSDEEGSQGVPISGHSTPGHGAMSRGTSPIVAAAAGTSNALPSTYYDIQHVKPIEPPRCEAAVQTEAPEGLQTVPQSARSAAASASETNVTQPREVSHVSEPTSTATNITTSTTMSVTPAPAVTVSVDALFATFQALLQSVPQRTEAVPVNTTQDKPKKRQRRKRRSSSDDEGVVVHVPPLPAVHFKRDDVGLLWDDETGGLG